MVHQTIKGHVLEVTVISTTTVAPALPVQEHHLALSNLDLLLPPMDVGVFFCYAGDGAGAALPATLKAALAKVLVAYYPLAGEVVANAAGEPELLCSGRGVDLAEASAGGAELRELRLGMVDESAEKLVPKKKAGVMCVQVTKFKCGGAVVGCTFDHRVCDAYSFNMFLVAWAAAARGCSPAPAPSFDRSFLAPSIPAPPSPDALADKLFVPVSCVLAPPAATEAASAAANRIFRVTAADVAALQASAGPGRTKLEAFTAHLWQLHARAAPPPRQRRSCCMGVVVDGRERLNQDGAMKDYFGNVLTIPYGAMSSGDLSGMALADVADDVHRWVMEAATGEHFRGLIDWVEALRPEPSVARAYLGGDDGAEAAACVVSSGMRMPVGEVDFGWGRPAFASYHFPWPGSAGYVMPMPSARGDGDWVVYVHAAPEVVKAMEEEPTVFKALESGYVFDRAL
ncbi:hypothetical protein E2562_033822 [Oryza meyeriana var. granulata]|uniref:Uncharacterized protein n=1 Tax=Oryza meyeriana var. granulata TaxID=110450 RepID=A0A6G1F156_9ORYZ|nr:hypothetical protein E2562_033822 [Oryza meyeriana var. granulata]